MARASPSMRGLVALTLSTNATSTTAPDTVHTATTTTTTVATGTPVDVAVDVAVVVVILLAVVVAGTPGGITPTTRGTTVPMGGGMMIFTNTGMRPGWPWKPVRHHPLMMYSAQKHWWTLARPATPPSTRATRST